MLLNLIHTNYKVSLNINLGIRLSVVKLIRQQFWIFIIFIFGGMFNTFAVAFALAFLFLINPCTLSLTRRKLCGQGKSIVLRDLS